MEFLALNVMDGDTLSEQVIQVLEPEDIVKAIGVILVLIIGGFLTYYVLEALSSML